MKVSYHARKRREASYDVIKREIANGMEIEEELARTLLDRADNRRFKDSDDRFILRRDLLGLYILTKKSSKAWLVVTHIDLSDSVRQSLLRKIYKRDPHTGSFTDGPGIHETFYPKGQDINYNSSLSKAIILKYSLDEINLIKQRVAEESSRFEDVEFFPCAFDFQMDIREKSHSFRISKKDPKRNTKVSLL